MVLQYPYYDLPKIDISYDPTALPVGADPQKLALYQIDTAGKTSRIYSESDVSNHRVRGFTSTLGRFVLMVDSRFAGSYVGTLDSGTAGEKHFEATVLADGSANFNFDNTTVSATVQPTGDIVSPTESRSGDTNTVTGKIVAENSRLTLSGEWHKSGAQAIFRGRQATVQVTISGFPADKKYYIDTTPQMPQIDLVANVDNPDEVSGCNRFVWEGILSYDATKYGAKIAKNFSYNKVISDTNGISGNHWKPQFIGPSVFGGGDLTIHVWVLRQGEPDNATPKRVPDTEIKDLKVLGKNPSFSEITSGLNNIVYAKILNFESSIQFGVGTRGYEGLPRWEVNPPQKNIDRGLQGVGLSQVTPPTNDQQLWNWGVNVTAGLKILEDKAVKARAYPKDVNASINSLSGGWHKWLVSFNNERKSNNLPAVEKVVVPDFIDGGWEFLPLGQVQYDALRGYNGFAGKDPGGLRLHEFTLAFTGEHKPATNYSNYHLQLSNIRQENNVWIGDASWVRVKPEERYPDNKSDPHYLPGNTHYVDDVLNKPFQGEN